MKDCFEINKPLDKNTYNFLKEFVDSERKIYRGVAPRFGVDGEFFTNPGENDFPASVPPTSQPTNFCPFDISSKTCISLNTAMNACHQWEADKWIEYLISKVFAPRGYFLNGRIEIYKVEFADDVKLTTTRKEIVVKNNEVNGKRLIVDYSINNLLGKHIPQTGLRSDGTKTKHQIQKEKQDAKIKKLEEKIAELENKIYSNSDNLSSNDAVLESFRKKLGYDGTLREFKDTLHNLLD